MSKKLDLSKMPEIIQLLGKLNEEDRARFILELPRPKLVQILDNLHLWSFPHQRPPNKPWRRWSARMGRGAGKTHTGAVWVNEEARKGKAYHRNGVIGIIGRTFQDARDTMVEDSSGILAVASPTFLPRYEPGKKKLTWPNGVVARMMTAEKPQSIRGKNLSAVWGDEVGFWVDMKEVWMEAVEPALRLGPAHALMTTTVKPGMNSRALSILEAEPGSIVTRGTMFDNQATAKHARDAMQQLYKGTDLEAQELLGESMDNVSDYLFFEENIEETRVFETPDFDEVVVAVDPAASDKKSSDETGIIVMGRAGASHYFVLEDCTGKYPPEQWAAIAIELYHKWGASCIVAETNNGGDMVETTVRFTEQELQRFARKKRARVTYREVKAKLSKSERMKPVALLYKSKRIHHIGVFAKLEKEMVEWVPKEVNQRPSPNRIDALVWAAYYLAGITEGERPVLNHFAAYM